jgi:hypothetical protein
MKTETKKLFKFIVTLWYLLTIFWCPVLGIHAALSTSLRLNCTVMNSCISNGVRAYYWKPTSGPGRNLHITIKQNSKM